eukprot:10305623-Alexandrium_andersonii.AAC.1
MLDAPAAPVGRPTASEGGRPRAAAMRQGSRQCERPRAIGMLEVAAAPVERPVAAKGDWLGAIGALNRSRRREGT